MGVLELIKKHEGFRATAYKDCEGVLTIGLGFRIDRFGFTEPEMEMVAEHRLDNLAIVFERDEPVIWKSATGGLKAAILDAVWQLGVTGARLKLRTVWALLAAGHADLARPLYVALPEYQMYKTRWEENWQIATGKVTI